MKYGFLSLLAFCICLLAFVKNYEVWTHPLNQIPEDVVEKKSEEKPKAPPAMEAQKDPNSIRSYIFIAEKNIFSPERKDFPIVSVEQSKTNVRPQVILYGVTIAGDYQAASVTSPGRPLRKGERETLTLKIGEKIGEYKLAKVSPDRIMFENNGDSFEVLLYDTRAPKKRMEVRTETKPPTAPSPSPTPTASPVPQAAPPATAPALPPASVEKPKEPQQQQITPSPPAPVARPVPRLWQRRMGRPAYPPTSPPTGVPGQ